MFFTSLCFSTLCYSVASVVDRIRNRFCFPPDQPFSNGLVTVMVPQLRRENSLLLWSTLDLNSPVHAFVGHDDVVLEFQWRPQKEGERDACQNARLSKSRCAKVNPWLSLQWGKVLHNKTISNAVPELKLWRSRVFECYFIRLYFFRI